MSHDNKCLICEMESHPAESHGRAILEYGCRRCGRYMVFRLEGPRLLGDREFRETIRPYRLSALLRERDVQKRPPLILRCTNEAAADIPGAEKMSVHEILRDWPRSIPDLLDRALMNLSRMATRIDHKLTLYSRLDYSLGFAQDADEFRSILYALKERNHVCDLSCDPTDETTLRMSINGWGRVAELERTSSPENPAFIAQWFGGTESETLMNSVFEAIRVGANEAGYKADRVDTEEHNQDIMDRMAAMVRAAPFMVADFTAHRNGVYYEAGMARGQGKPVIHTCRKGELDDAHFDVEHMNFLLWEKPEDLQPLVKNRILGSIGEGPHRKTKP